jgi:hypothetical protein
MTNRNTSRSANVCIAFSLAIALFSTFASGQATTGSISGRVADSSGSVIPGAKVSIHNLDNGLVTAAITDNSGEFTETALPPDHYSISVEKAGFALAKVSSFVLDIDQKARFNLTMKIDSVSTDVTVSDTEPVLQLQGAETGQVIDGREIADLPTLGRDFTTLLTLVPGVVKGAGGNNLSFSVNGQREFSNSYQINGVEVTGLNNDTNVRPSPDAIQEFKLVTSTYAPEFGRASGGAILIQTKAGTNNIHGSGIFLYRPTATAANNNFAAAGSSPTTVQKNYGVTIGGPLKKDKAFLFLAYEGFKNSFSDSYLGETLVGQNEVSFDSAGDADLSQLIDPYTGIQDPIFDPYFFANNYYTYQFPGNIIPASDVSIAGKNIVQQLFPAPRGSAAGNPYENFQTTEFYTQSSNVANLRTDYTFSQNNRLYLTYDAEQGTYNSTDPYAGAIPIKGGGGGDTGGLTAYENHAIALTYDHTFTQNLLNEARATYFLSPTTQKSLVDGTDLATKFGIQNANIPGFPTTYGFPQIQTGTGAVTGGSTYKPLTSREKVIGLMDSISYTRGRHNIKVGYEYRNIDSHSDYSLFPVPYEYFGAAYSALTSDSTYCYYTYSPCDNAYGFYNPSAFYGTGGAEIADILLGLPEAVFQGLQLKAPETKSNEHTVYGQDYWQITPRLNLTFGLRYEYVQPYVEASNNQSNFDLSTLMINIAGRGSNSRSLVNSNMADFMPRVGLAFQLNPTTVLRGGFGIFYSHENDSRDIILTENYPFYTEQSFSNNPYSLNYQLSTGEPRQTTDPVPSSVASIDLTTVPDAKTQVVNSEPKNFPTAYSRNYNFTLQQQLDRSTSFELGFVGANSRDLTEKVGNYNINAHLSSKLNQVQVIQPIGLSNYSSLQAKIDRKFNHGYSALIAYTWSHNLDNGPAPPNLGRSTNYPQNPFDIAAEYSNSDIDVRNNFTAAQLIELPFGRGKRFLTHANKGTDLVLGGWQLNSITTLHSGIPFNVVSNTSNAVYPGLRPDLIGNPRISHPTKDKWFNTSAFKVPAGQSNSTGAGMTLITGDAGRNILNGPGYTDEDVSLFKSLSLPHEMKFQVRVEAFNVLNTGRYGQPDGDLNHAGTVSHPGSFGSITGGGGYQRIMQFGGRLTF